MGIFNGCEMQSQPRMPSRRPLLLLLMPLWRRHPLRLRLPQSLLWRLLWRWPWQRQFRRL